MSKIHCRTAFMAVFLALFGAGAAFAQPDIVVVTTSRAEASLVDEPAAISVLAPSAALRGLVSHPAELINRAPGLFVQAGSGQEHLTALRSPVLTGAAGAGSFLYLQDGVPLRSAGFANVNGLFDAQTGFAERVEVVRGPGDVSYGSNAVHGSINVLTRDPLSEATNRGWVRVSAGAFGRYAAAGELSGSNVFAALSVSRDGGYRADSGGDQVKALLAKGWQSGDRKIRFRLSVHDLAQETAGFVLGDNSYKDDNLRRSNPNPDAFRDARSVQTSLAVEDNWRNWALKVTPYLLSAEMRFRMHFLPSQAIEENSHSAFGILSSASRDFGDGMNVLIGLDAEHAVGNLREEQFIPRVFSFTPGLHYDYQVTSEAIAPFIRFRYNLSNRFSLQAGGRVTTTRYDYDNRIADGVVGRFQRVSDRSDSVTAVTAKVASIYRLSDRLSVFTSVARGARPPQTTDLYRIQINETIGDVAPETLDMAEAGLRFIAPKWRAEMAGYTGTKKKFRFRNADGFTVTDGRTTHRGVEVDIEGMLREALTLRVSGTLARHQYDFDSIVAQSSEIIRSGSDVDTAPRRAAFVEIAWAPTARFDGAISFNHVGPYFTDAANEHRYPGHEVTDVRLGTDIGEVLRFDARITNIFDTRYATRADFAFGRERYFPGEERALKVSIGAKF